MNERIKFVDNAKGILILLVIIGHEFTAGYVHDFIYTFHMPAFFLISGMFFSWTKSPKDFFLGKIRTFIIPMIFFEIIGAAYYNLNNEAGLNIFGFMVNSLTLHFNNAVNWFMFSLLVAQIMLYIIKRLSESDWLLYVIAIISFIIASVFSLSGTDEYYLWLLGRTCVAFSLLVLGSALRKFFLSFSTIATVLCTLIVILLAIFNAPVEIAHMELMNPILFLLGSVAGTYAVIQLGRITPVFNYFGNNSLTIMGTQLATRYVAHLIISNLYIVVILAALFEYPVIYLINRYAPILAGKRKASSPQKLSG